MARRLTLDSGALSAWVQGGPLVRAELRALAEAGTEVVTSSVVLAECTTGDGPRDAAVNQLGKALQVVSADEVIARRAGRLRYLSRRPDDTIDALVVATADLAGGRRVLTADVRHLRALAEGTDVVVVPLG